MKKNKLDGLQGLTEDPEKLQKLVDVINEPPPLSVDPSSLQLYPKKNKKFENDIIIHAGKIDVCDGKGGIKKSYDKGAITTILLKHNGCLSKVCDEIGVTNYASFYRWYYNYMPVKPLEAIFRQRMLNRAMDVLWEGLEQKDTDIATFVVKVLGKNILYTDTPIVNIDQRKLTPEQQKQGVYNLFGIVDERKEEIKKKKQKIIANAHMKRMENVEKRKRGRPPKNPKPDIDVIDVEEQPKDYQLQEEKVKDILGL